MSTRVFTREELDGMGLPNCWRPEWAKQMKRRDADAVAVFDEVVEHGDWEITMRLIFLAPDDGKHYEIYYKQGATEMQEDTDPWDYKNQVEASEVELMPVVRTEWRPVRSGMMQLGNCVVSTGCVRPYAPAQGIADEVAHGCWAPDFERLRQTAEELNLVHSMIYAPDTGLPAVLTDYLDRAEAAHAQKPREER